MESIDSTYKNLTGVDIEQQKCLWDEFYDIALSDISYVKLSNLGVWKQQKYTRNTVASGYEIELYSAK